MIGASCLHANDCEEFIRKIRSGTEMGKRKGIGYGIKSKEKAQKIEKEWEFVEKVEDKKLEDEKIKEEEK